MCLTHKAIASLISQHRTCATQGLQPPLTLLVSSGDRLTVDTAPGPGGPPVPTLTGPALDVPALVRLAVLRILGR